MALCEYKIAANLENSCDIIGGLKEIGYLINKQDLEGLTYVSGSDNTVNAITLAEGTYAYKIYTPTNQPFNGTNVTLEEGTVINRFTKTAAFVVLEHNDDTALAMEKLANGKFVAIIENEYEGDGGASSWEIYGAERGLKANEITRDPYSDEQAGGWSVSMQEVGASKAAIFFFATSAAATKAALEALLEPASNDDDDNQ